MQVPGLVQHAADSVTVIMCWLQSVSGLSNLKKLNSQAECEKPLS